MKTSDRFVALVALLALAGICEARRPGVRRTATTGTSPSTTGSQQTSSAKSTAPSANSANSANSTNSDPACLDKFVDGFPTWCSTEYDPVCAICPDGQITTYMNMCYYSSTKCGKQENETCVFKHEGACVESDYRSERVCSNNYAPICAECGPTGRTRTFLNYCHYTEHNEKHGQDRNLICYHRSEGECNQAPKPMSPVQPHIPAFMERPRRKNYH